MVSKWINKLFEHNPIQRFNQSQVQKYNSTLPICDSDRICCFQNDKTGRDQGTEDATASFENAGHQESLPLNATRALQMLG